MSWRWPWHSTFGMWTVLYWTRYSFKYNQQDATLCSILYCCQCCTRFGRFLRPSSGAQKLYTQHLVYVKLSCCGSSKQAWHIPDAVCTVFELLMMGGKIARNMQSIGGGKEYCITLHLVGYTWEHTLTMHGPVNVRLNTVFANTVRRVNKCPETGWWGTLWTLFETLCIVIIRFTETFWWPCILRFRGFYITSVCWCGMPSLHNWHCKKCTDTQTI